MSILRFLEEAWEASSRILKNGLALEIGSLESENEAGQVPKTPSEQEFPDDCVHHHHDPKPLHSSASESAIEKAASMFKALSDPGRLRILEALSQQECCVSDLALLNGDEVYTISQRLRVLRGERLVERRRDGKHMIYRLADCHVADLIQNAFAHASEEHP